MYLLFMVFYSYVILECVFNFKTTELLHEKVMRISIGVPIIVNKMFIF